jgi:hypothetical protein
MHRILAVAFAMTLVMMAVVETVTTPTPALGYGRVANIISLVVWSVTLPIVHAHHMI